MDFSSWLLTKLHANGRKAPNPAPVSLGKRTKPPRPHPAQKKGVTRTLMLPHALLRRYADGFTAHVTLFPLTNLQDISHYPCLKDKENIDGQGTGQPYTASVVEQDFKLHIPVLQASHCLQGCKGRHKGCTGVVSAM